MHQPLADGPASVSPHLFGILYAEDFDDPEPKQAREEHTPSAAPPVPTITQADVTAACEAAVLAARKEWERGRAQKHVDAIAALAPLLTAIKEAAENSALAAAEGTVTTILSMIAGLLPEFSRAHGAAEVRTLLNRLLPTIRSQTRISVRVHPDLVALIERDVAMLEPAQAALIDVAAASLEPGDVKVSWENGSMNRNSSQIITAVQDALSQLGLHRPVEASSKQRMAYAD
ncbi:MAG: FliH/SctL family protein [Acetobacteraceae bacterium]|nr:FliH/SctL family protein [Acetobacteraceae bacterium]